MYMENEDGAGRRKGGRRYSASVTTGAIALVFLVIGFQTALFVHKAAVMAIISRRDSPDTVYVMDRALAERLAGSDDPVQGVSAGEMARSRSGTSVPDASGIRSGTGVMSGGGAGSGPWGVEAGTSSDKVIVRKNSAHSAAARSVYSSHARRKVESFFFDPNTVSAEDLYRLGFSEKQAGAIVNYRLKGGRFRRKSDFARSYVVADSVYERLEPYIRIPLVDLNLADSAAFDALPGIGGHFAAKMVEYRSRLGGYSYKEQLMDIRNFGKERYDALCDLVTVDTSFLRPYPLWTLPEDSLGLHPYIGKNAAHGIVLFRENNPPSEWSVEAVCKAGILRYEMAVKLSNCKIDAIR